MATPLAQAILQADQFGASPTPFRATVAPTNYIQANSDYNNAIEQTYLAKLQQQNALWGGLAGIGSAGVLTLPKLLGGGGGGSSLAQAAGVGNDVSNADILSSIGATSDTAGDAGAALLALL